MPAPCVVSMPLADDFQAWAVLAPDKFVLVPSTAIIVLPAAGLYCAPKATVPMVKKPFLGALHVLAENEGLTFHFRSPRTVNRAISSAGFTVCGRANVEISAYVCSKTGIRLVDVSRAVAHMDGVRRGECAIVLALIGIGAVGGDEGGDGYGGHHGNCDCGGGQGAGMREGAGRYHSRSRVMLWRRAPRSASEQSLHHVP